jgi:hypothetical protein
MIYYIPARKQDVETPLFAYRTLPAKVKIER